MSNLAKEQERGVLLQWVRPPQQARTRQSLTRLLDAAEALVAEKGFNDAGVAEIVQRAGTSVGGFYRRFRDKDGLLQALHERFCEEARTTADAALDPGRWVGSSVEEILTAFTEFLVRIYREREGFFRAFIPHGVSNTEVRERTDRLFNYLVERLGALLRTRRDEIRHPDPELAAAFGLHVVVGTLNHTVLSQSQAISLSDDRLAPELSRAFASYVGAASPKIKLHRRSS
jgi:AcrR family transcriptional regulator